MAKQSNNVVTHGLTGKIGDLPVFRVRDGKTVISKVFKNPFVLWIVCVLFFMATGCGEHSESNSYSLDFYLELEADPENLDGAIPVINEFLSKLPNELTGEQKLNMLEKWLIKQPCVVYAHIDYYSAIRTVPPTGELTVKFKEMPLAYVMDVLWTNPMIVTRFHDAFYEHEGIEEAVEVPIVEYSLNETSCQWSDATYLDEIISGPNSRRLIVINSDKELKNYITCTGNSSYPAIDFTKHTMLLAFGVTSGKVLTDATYLRLYSSGYVLHVDHRKTITASIEYWQIAIITDKLAKESNVDLKLTLKYS